MSNHYDSYGRPAQGAAQPAAASQVHPPPHNAPVRTSSLEPLQFTATFVPGGSDDYYMPEVLAPAPQRIMPEVPQNMQEDLQRLESGARSTDFSSESSYNAPPPNGTAPTGSGPAASFSAPSSEPPASSKPKPSAFSNDTPTFSPFPTIREEGIPPSFEDTEEALWSTREHTLHSNDVPLQINWAKDVLNWVEITMEAQARELAGRKRPPTPKVEHQMRVDALVIINHLAEQEHPDALFLRSKWLEFGKFDHREDKREAFNGYRRAAELGMARAEYRMGMLFEASNDMRNAIQHYERGLELGDSAASYRLGMMYLMGQHGRNKDYHYGLRLIEAAADTADVDAPQGAYVYGLLIAKELPDISIPEGLLPCQLPMAKRYIEKAALLGFAKAQLKMGQAYELCQLGCDFNPSYSLHYYGLAAKQGQHEASLGVSRWFLFGYEGFFNKNEQLAFKYAKEAADGKLATGEFAMGYYHEIGIHVPIDVREAKRWYELAAEHGNKDAVGRLESLNDQKTLTKQDHETTTLTRIKSQHGSMRGKRPERLARLAAAMPAVSESEMDQQRLSPRVSPRQGPVGAGQGGAAGVPDMSRLSFNDSQAPAYSVGGDGPAGRPVAAAVPYPTDDRPVLPGARSQSAAPYPEDDMMVRPSQGASHYDHSIRPSQGPKADRPGSAFGIRPPSPGGAGGGRPPPQGAPAFNQGGYRQPNINPGMNDHRRDPYRQDLPRPATTQPHDGRPGSGHGNPNQGRLQNPNQHVQRPVSSMAGSQYPGPQGPRNPAVQPGREFGPRTSSRPSHPTGPPSHSSGPPSRPASEAYGRAPSGGRPGHPDSLPPNPHPAHSGPRPAAHVDRPRLDDGLGRVGTAPPSSHRLQAKPASPTASTVSAPPRPTAAQGPATFEEMGIPPGKSDSDCVVM